MNDARVGLCADCQWVRIVRNKRESVFYRCLRADTDPRFVRYPPLPMLACPGFDRRAAHDDPLAESHGDGDEG